MCGKWERVPHLGRKGSPSVLSGRESPSDGEREGVICFWGKRWHPVCEQRIIPQEPLPLFHGRDHMGESKSHPHARSQGSPHSYLPALLQERPRSAERVMENELQRDPSSDALPWARPKPFPRPPLRGNRGTSCPRVAWERPAHLPEGSEPQPGERTADCLPPTGVLPLETLSLQPGHSWPCVLAGPASSWVVPRAGSPCLHTFAHCSSFHLECSLRALADPSQMPAFQPRPNASSPGSPQFSKIWKLACGVLFHSHTPTPMRGEKSLPVGFKS